MLIALELSVSLMLFAGFKFVDSLVCVFQYKFSFVIFYDIGLTSAD